MYILIYMQIFIYSPAGPENAQLSEWVPGPEAFRTEAELLNAAVGAVTRLSALPSAAHVAYAHSIVLAHECLTSLAHETSDDR